MDRIEKIIEEVLLEEKAKRDRCLRIADRKYDKPSAYKSGAVVKCRKGMIWKGLKEGKNLLATSPQDLVRSLPQELKSLLFKQWSAKQNPKWHPEGNTLKHILVVLKRAYHHYPNDPNMIMAALFHDLGKMDTYTINPKTNLPTAYGHEDESTEYVEKFKDWIESFEGTNVEEIKYLVKNHMKIKPSTWDVMKDKKKEPIQSHPSFDKLRGFTDKLDGGGTNLQEELIREKVKETLRTWFSRKGEPGKKGGWVDCNSPIRKDGKITGYKACGREKGEKRAKYPSCRPTPSKCKDPGKGKKWGKTK